MMLKTNNNGKCIGKIAKSSIRYSRMRNIFVILTIALSVSLLAVMGMFAIGNREANKKIISGMQHVIFEKVDQNQITQLSQDENLEEYLLYKSGKPVTVDDYMYNPIYFDVKDGKMETMEVSEGTYPQKENEAAVYPEFMKELGKEAKIGEQFELTFLDGKTKSFVVSGFIKGTPFNKSYPFLISKAYADNGSQMKEIAYSVLARIQGAASMSQARFKDKIWEIGDAYGIHRADVNPNGNFESTLMGDRMQQEIMLNVGLGLGLLAVSVLVIYSIFYISVVGRIRQFGQFRTIGMTKKQIKKMVTKEGVFLSLVGIPLGLIIGNTIGYFILPDGFNWFNTIILSAVIAAAEFITILISVRKPSKLASDISPIEAVKYTAYSGKVKKSQTKKLHRAITPASMARMGFVRNWKKTMLTMISLGLGGILFMCGVTFLNSINKDEFSRQGQFSIGEYVIDFSSNARETAEYGSPELQLDNPFNDTLKQQILDIPGVKKIYTPQGTTVKYEFMGDYSQETVRPFTKEQVDEMNGELEEGDINYDEMIQNDEILIQGNSLVKEIYGENFKVGDHIELIFYNGQEVKKTYTVRGFIDIGYQSDVGWPMFWLPDAAVTDIMGDINLTSDFIVSADFSQDAQITPILEKLISADPKLNLSTLAEHIEQDEMVFNSMYGMILGLAIFIIAFSTINMINTIITNIVTRKQEFAVLQSIGMSSKQLTKMIQIEGLILAFTNALITLILGTGLGLLIFYIFSNMGVDYFHYHFPGWYLLGYTIFIVLVPVTVSAGAIRSFKKEAVVERMRATD